MAIKHSFTSTLSDDSDTTLVRPSNWNADHTIEDGTVDHGTKLTGLTDDDHTQYSLLAGRSGGQTLKGGTGVADGLTLQATSGVGANAEFIRGLVGNNGSLEMFRASVNGGFHIGNLSSPGTAFAVATSEATFPGGDWIAWFQRESSTGANELTFRLQHFSRDQIVQPILVGMGARGTKASPTPIQQDNYMLIIDGRGYDGTAVDYGEYAVGWTDTQAQMAFQTVENWSGSAHGTRILFKITPTSTLSPVEVLRFDGDYSIASHANSVFRILNQNRFRHKNSIVVASKTADQTAIGVNAWTTIVFGSEDFDTDTLHDNSTDNSRITFPIAGKWLLQASLYADVSGVTTPTKLAGRFLINGAGSTFGYQDIPIGTPTDPGMSTCAVVSVAANDYAEFQAIVLGASGTWDAKDSDITRFSAFYIGE